MPAPNLNSEDYYQILGVDRNADDSELKKAYRKLAVKVSYWTEVCLYAIKHTKGKRNICDAFEGTPLQDWSGDSQRFNFLTRFTVTT